MVAALDAERGQPVGWAIPLTRSEGEDTWSTTTWSTRRGEVFLRPGTSPAGLRLPLDALAWTPPPVETERSRFAPTTPLPRHAAGPAGAPRPSGGPQVAIVPPEKARPGALCVQERDGHVFVFLPPFAVAEGNKPARASPTSATALRYCASNCFTVWLETSTMRSRRSSSGS